MKLNDIQELIDRLDKQSLDFAYLTYPYPKSRKNHGSKLRTPFGLCEVLSVNSKTNRANISVSKAQIKKLYKKLMKELHTAELKNLSKSISIKTDPDTGESYLDLKEVLEGTGVNVDSVKSYNLTPSGKSFILEVFDSEGKRISLGGVNEKK